MNRTFEDKKKTVLVALGILGRHVRAEVAEAAADPTPDTAPLRHATERFDILCRVNDALLSFEEPEANDMPLGFEKPDDATQAESDGACRLLIETLYAELDRVRPFVYGMDARDFEMLVYLLDALLDGAIEAEHARTTKQHTRNAYMANALTYAASEWSKDAWAKLATTIRELPTDHYVTEPFNKKPAALACARHKVAALTFDAEDLERFGVDAKKVAALCFTEDDCKRFGLDPIVATLGLDADGLERYGVDFAKLPYVDELCAEWEDTVRWSVENDGDALFDALVETLADHDLEYTKITLPTKITDDELTHAEEGAS